MGPRPGDRRTPRLPLDSRAAVAFSATHWLDLRAGGYLTTGEDALDSLGRPDSEYGLVPTVLYASLAAFF